MNNLAYSSNNNATAHDINSRGNAINSSTDKKKKKFIVVPLSSTTNTVSPSLSKLLPKMEYIDDSTNNPILGIDFGLDEASNLKSDISSLIVFAKDLMENIEPMTPECKKLIRDNFWDLLS
jgi:hypothetical protein